MQFVNENLKEFKAYEIVATTFDRKAYDEVKLVVVGFRKECKTKTKGIVSWDTSRRRALICHSLCLLTKESQNYNKKNRSLGDLYKEGTLFTALV